MSALRRFIATCIAILLAPLPARGQAAQHAVEASPGPALRQLFLATTPSQAGIKPTPEWPHVYGVAVDLPTGEYVATIVSMADGSASLYTTAAFGIVGGAAHESVRVAARRFVHEAEKQFAASVLVTAYPYPTPGKVRFYLLGYDGVRMIEVDMVSIESQASPCTSLFIAGQYVLNALRQTVERK